MQLMIIDIILQILAGLSVVVVTLNGVQAKVPFQDDVMKRYRLPCLTLLVLGAVYSFCRNVTLSGACTVVYVLLEFYKRDNLQ